jgi:ribosomal protein S18 acetylase RimI-like enzyme
MQRAQKLGVEVAHIEIPQDKTMARRILTRLGFRLVRRLLHLKLRIAEVHQNNMERASLGCRYLQRGEEEILTKIQNRSFAGLWGYNPNTVAEITYRINLSNRQDILLTCDEDRVTGYSWMEINEDKEDTSASKKGRICMLGIDPEYRSKAIGEKVLLASLAHLKKHDVAVAEITVDSENKVARSLYQKIGFKIKTSSLWYEKTVNQVTGAK